ncbi:hypothetical protein An16g08600 [Aspergillus niger]|uniref:Uncharacterized protein n=2 Tax=Aspergillus niger TaxID=5061 RepID=A2R8W6_ASPNC|nr:hypothetical protein An16g08600 [Aspergillus niger]CAK42959.1 hypothetical protein An16g08600 [Aspergillus niger]
MVIDGLPLLCKLSFYVMKRGIDTILAVAASATNGHSPARSSAKWATMTAQNRMTAHVRLKGNRVAHHWPTWALSGSTSLTSTLQWAALEADPCNYMPYLFQKLKCRDVWNSLDRDTGQGSAVALFACGHRLTAAMFI